MFQEHMRLIDVGFNYAAKDNLQQIEDIVIMPH